MNTTYSFKGEKISVSWEGEQIRISSEQYPRLSLLVLVTEQILHQSSHPYHTYKCKVLRDGATDVKFIEVHEDDFLSSNDDWLWKELGLVSAASEENREVIYQLLKNSVFDAHERVVHDCIGWLNLDVPEFVYGPIKLTPRGRETVENIRPGLDVGTITDAEACNFITESFMLTFNNAFYAGAMLCFSALSMLKPLLAKHGLFPRFTLYICGQTGTGKSSTGFPMLNPFGLPSVSVNDSLAAAMEIVNGNRASVTVFDDLKSARNLKALQIVETITRIASDENTSYRRYRGRKVESVSMYNLAAFTAEIEPPLQTSSFPRLLILPFDKATVHVEKLKIMEQNSKDFQRKSIAFLLRFLEYFLTTPYAIERFVGDFEAEQEHQRQQLDGLHGRYYETLAWMIVVWRKIGEFCMQRGGISLDSQDFPSWMQKLVVNQHKRYSPKSPALMYCTALFALVDCGKIKIVDEADRNKADFVEIIDCDGVWQIRSVVVFGKIKQFYNDQEIDFNYTEATIRKDLLAAGLIERSKALQTNTTDNRRIRGRNFSYISFFPGRAGKWVNNKEE